MADRMNIQEMTRLCRLAVGKPNQQIRVIAHEVLQEYEYIDFHNLSEPGPVRRRHRIRQFHGKWSLIY